MTFDIKQFIATHAADAAQERMEKMTGDQLADVLEDSIIDKSMDAGFAIVHNIRLENGEGPRAVAISTCYGEEGECYLLTGL